MGFDRNKGCHHHTSGFKVQRTRTGSEKLNSNINERFDLSNINRNIGENKAYTIKNEHSPTMYMQYTRRDMFRSIAACVAATLTTSISFPSEASTTNTSVVEQSNEVNNRQQSDTSNKNSSKKDITGSSQKSLQSIDIKKSIDENKVNITLVKTLERDITDEEIYIDRKRSTKVQRRVYPTWIPPIFQQSPTPIREITDIELLVSGIIAGSFTEIFRTLLLYPLSTIKSRVQFNRSNAFTNIDLKNRKNGENKSNDWKMRMRAFSIFFKRRYSTRKLYAGILPTLLVAAPASGVYYGIRDVTRTELTRAILTPSKQDEIIIALAGALIGDIICLAVRAPALTYSLRRQVVTGNNNIDEDIAEELNETWLKKSWEQLPSIIITDLPYLLLRITLILTLSNGDEGIAQFELLNISVACFCALITTPFDVARTRILVDSDGDPSNGLDGGSGESVWMTMRNVMNEGKSDKGGNTGGVRNLYAGWLERTLYFGVGVAWFDPIRVLGYLGIRDAVLLQWFD